jgi:Icc-related predicted phosphoesterase
MLGDISNMSTLSEMIDFNSWIRSLKEDGTIKQAIITVGNHEKEFARSFSFASEIVKEAVILFDEMHVFEDKVFYGSPWTQTYGTWYFMKDPPDLLPMWKAIPKGVDVLITHQPPFGVLDTVFERMERGWEGVKKLNVGCKHLKREVLDRIKPKLHVFGHLHADGGRCLKINDTMFCNAAIMNDFYVPARQAQVFDI